MHKCSENNNITNIKNTCVGADLTEQAGLIPIAVKNGSPKGEPSLFSLNIANRVSKKKGHQGDLFHNKLPELGGAFEKNIYTSAQLRNVIEGRGAEFVYKKVGLETKKALKKLVRKRFFSYSFAQGLMSLNSPLFRSYSRTLNCGCVLRQEGVVLKAVNYCNGRWCSVCNSIRTAKLIEGYLPVLKSYEEKFFVTLTIRNCIAQNLSIKIKEMYNTFCLIKDLMRKRKTKIIGLRKLEVTYNSDENTFHPHFHFVILGSREIADEFVFEWRKKFPKETSDKAQDVRVADDDSLLELFKYFTKIVAKKYDAKGRMKSCKIWLRKQDIIFRSMDKKRTFQPFGIKKICEDVKKEDLISQRFADLPENYCEWIYDHAETDYVRKIVVSENWEQKEFIIDRLSGYKPSKNILRLLNGMDST